MLVPFGDSRALGKEIADLLTDDVRREAMRRRAYACGRIDDLGADRAAQRYLPGRSKAPALPSPLGTMDASPARLSVAASP